MLLFSGLTEKELEQAKNWYDAFSEADKQTLDHVFSVFKDWAKEAADQDFIKWNMHPFFVGYAVGSTITDKENPNDIDILIATDVWISEKKAKGDEFPLYSPSMRKFAHDLGKDYEIEIKDDVSERYDNEVDCRIMVEINPKERQHKEIDLIYQYDVLSRARWEFNDKYASVPLFVIGDPTKNRQTKDTYRPGMGWSTSTLPMDVYSLNEARGR